MKGLGIILFLFLISCVYANCDDGQIDINSASAKELDELSGIGPAKAEAIIKSRPFDSLEDLLDVSGIGEATLEKIKEQDLACVDEKDEKKKTEKEETKIEEKFVESVEKNAPLGVPQIAEGGGKKPIEAIRLNAQNIKSENDEFIEEPKKSNYGIYLLGGFCVLLGILFGVKKLRKDKNEFR